MANENVLTDEQKPFVPADTVDSQGTVWPTVGENIRKGVNGELADVYDRMPDIDAVAEFWCKLTGKLCKCYIVDVEISNGLFTNATNGFTYNNATLTLFKRGETPLFFYFLDNFSNNGSRIAFSKGVALSTHLYVDHIEQVISPDKMSLFVVTYVN